MQTSLVARVFSRTNAIGRVMLTAPRKPHIRRIRMTRSQPRSNKAPPRAKQAVILPKLGTALNWVPPKPPSGTNSRPKRRPLAPQ